MSSTSVPRTGNIWKNIKQTVIEDPHFRGLFLRKISIELGDGQHTSFWDDCWAVSTPLKVMFPNLYEVSLQKHHFVAQMGWYEGGAWRWALSWESPLNQQQQQELQDLQQILIHKSLTEEKHDALHWKPRESKGFSVQLLSKTAMSRRNVGNSVDSIVCLVWRKIAPPKVALMVWIALMGKLNNKDMLHRKDILGEEQNTCTLCNLEPETSDHILVTCSTTWGIWCRCSQGWNPMIVTPRSLKKLFELWLNIKRKSRIQKKIWIATFFFIVWSI